MVATTLLISRSGDSIDGINSAPSTQHNYGTRTRQNSFIRPSARLRQSPDSSGLHRKLKLMSNIRTKPGNMPQTPVHPLFPPPNVMLHSEDANNKVLMAIGRSFLSVDNRAMTIKDLAEMCMNFGLSCQSASAAGQAITSFIRSHMQRCENEQDQPLLLKHVLTGTPSDDELVSALHSRSGGAHCTITTAENRLTNFRRGTMIWYLSKAAGAPCPFARAGIQLCDYKDGGDIKPERHCGQKRKRSLRARSCRDGSDSDDVISDTEKRAPKVKLTLRLKPPHMLSVMSTPSSTPESTSTASSFRQRSPSLVDLSKYSDMDDYSMSAEVSEDDDLLMTSKPEESIFPPYPRQSISIPAYTPSVEDLYPELFAPASNPSAFRRSPSVPHSIASPPPDSDDEEDVCASGMAARRRHSSALLRPSPSKSESRVDFGVREDDFELGTQCESPGPRSPWTHPGEEGIIIKEEPGDVGVILEAWEHMDDISNAKVAVFSDRSPFDLKAGVKPEYSVWDWSGFESCESEVYVHATEEADSVIVKEEDVDNTIILSDKEQLGDDPSMSGPLSAIEPSYLSDYRVLTDARRHSEILWKDAELLGPDSVRLQDFEDGHWPQPRISATRTRARTSPSLFASLIDSSRIKQDPCSPDREAGCESVPKASVTRPTVNSTTSSAQDPDQTIVYTIRPLTPAICVAQVDGISIYQLVLDSYPLLRRFDTDFVNLSRIAEYLKQPKSLLESVSPAKDVAEGCPLIRGKWVPLENARNFVNGCSPIQSVLDTFLSENLYEQFPPCIQVMYHSNQHIRSHNQFGPRFRSMVEDSRPLRLVDDQLEATTPWERAHWDDDHLISVHPSLGPKSIEIPLPALGEDRDVPETPLSPTEQEIFHSFCGSPEWDIPSPAVMEIAANSGKENEEIRPAEERLSRGGSARTLRRSKRVADAIASRSRTRSGKTRANML